MKFYELDTQFTFGSFEGKTLQEVVAIRASYIDWCLVNLDHFCITGEVLDGIKEIKPGFELTVEAAESLSQKNRNWENDLEDESFHAHHEHDYYDHNDYRDDERDTFDAVTDGQYGDYDDWKEGGGDMDHLMDCLGF